VRRRGKRQRQLRRLTSFWLVVDCLLVDSLQFLWTKPLQGLKGDDVDENGWWFFGLTHFPPIKRTVLKIVIGRLPSPGLGQTFYWLTAPVMHTRAMVVSHHKVKRATQVFGINTVHDVRENCRCRARSRCSLVRHYVKVTEVLSLQLESTS
jgi:hypothetical protein